MTDDHCAAANAADRLPSAPAPSSAIGIAARNVGSGSQTSKAGRGKDSGGVWKLQIASVVRPRPSTRFRETPT